MNKPQTTQQAIQYIMLGLAFLIAAVGGGTLTYQVIQDNPDTIPPTPTQEFFTPPPSVCWQQGVVNTTSLLVRDKVGGRSVYTVRLNQRVTFNTLSATPHNQFTYVQLLDGNWLAREYLTLSSSAPKCE